MSADVTQRILYRPAVLRALRNGEDVSVEYLGPRKPANAGPPPRYDAVYWEGTARLDAMARGEIPE